MGLSEDTAILCEVGVETYGFFEGYPAIGLSQFRN